MLTGGDAGYNRRHSFNIQLLLHGEFVINNLLVFKVVTLVPVF